MDRLFVPLKGEFYEDFRQNGKTYELRAYGGQYTEKHVRPGRLVELRLGYSGKSQWGTVGRVVVGSLTDILQKVDFRQITPREKTTLDFLASVSMLYCNRPKYIAFEVMLGKQD